ncbi:MXAN_6230/SCO0854 family RING domain-containing protein [Streptomyces sp. NPDC000594]|uniref:MXAN_6230/SCO0854 family RING domain-containing protein n=1 Tax=Streptomyces sp. NPDC000594 TaxID=3154261 RepID=UPI003321EA87
MGRSTKGGRRTLAEVLLARRGAVYTPEGTAPVSGGAPPVPAGLGIPLLETDLLDRGFLLAPGLRRALGALDTTTLAGEGTALLAAVDSALGADRDHTPLFRDFPHSTPHDTDAFYVDRVLTLLLQAPEQPCVLCGTDGTVRPVRPCAHLVCGACFDGADLSACPVCHRRIDADSPFLRPSRPRPAAAPDRALPARTRILAHGGGPAARAADAAAELAALLARPNALGPQDTDDLAVLLDEAGDRADTSWLPGEIPGRETKARLLAWLLHDPGHHTTTVPAAVRLITTATDVLRLLVVGSGGDPGLTEPPRFGPVPRPLRRALLGALDALDPVLLTEDLLRHPKAWLHAAERLHPFEKAGRHPRTALGFAVLRGLRLTDDALSRTLRDTARGLPHIDASGDRVTVRSWTARVEAAVAAADVTTALDLLARRPGELLRRLDHLLRLTTDGPAAEAVTTVLEKAVPGAAPAVLVSALGALRARHRGEGAAGERVFFPKGAAAKPHIEPERRDPLPPGAAARAVEILDGEVLRRAGELPRAAVAVVDTALAGLIAPFGERTASRALHTLPRGSELPLPDGRTVRLFLHWMDNPGPDGDDLDLSAALFDAAWRHLGTCDYTNLRYGTDAAVHSGDLTSAPPPAGASEFIDLDLDRLDRAGVRHLVVAVFSYSDTPFTELPEAFAGLMVRDGPGGSGPVFDPRQVEQRFDLTSPARASVPLVIDVAARTLRWLDVVRGVTGTRHAVHRHVNHLTTLGRSLTGLFASGARVGLLELAVRHAAARARTVVLRHPDGTATVYRRRDTEDAGAFAGRIGTPDDDPGPVSGADGPQLGYLLHGDADLPAGSEVYALYPGALDARTVRLLTASDLVTSLAPAP